MFLLNLIENLIDSGYCNSSKALNEINTIRTLLSSFLRNKAISKDFYYTLILILIRLF